MPPRLWSSGCPAIPHPLTSRGAAVVDLGHPAFTPSTPAQLKQEADFGERHDAKEAIRPWT